MLLEHYICSKNYEKGADYSKLAEKKAEKTASLNDAVVYAKKRISCLDKLPVDDDVERKIIDARAVLGLYCSQLGSPVEAKEAVDPIVDLAIKRNYKRRVSQINVILGFYYQMVNEDYPKALEYYEKAIKIGEKLNDYLTLVMANNFMGGCLWANCEFEKALSCYEKALGINVMANVQWGIAAIKTNIIFCVYGSLGNVELAYQTSQEVLKIADETGDILSLANANLAYGCSYFLKGYLEKAEKHLLKAVDFFRKSNLPLYMVFSKQFLGDTYYFMKKYKTSQEFYEKAISIYRSKGWVQSGVYTCQTAVALAKVMNKEKDIRINEIFECYEKNKMKLTEGFILDKIGKILLNIDDQHISEAEGWIKRSIEMNQKYGMMWNLARDYALYADLFKRKRDLSKAKEKLNRAIDIFKECGADGWVEKYEKELASFS